MKSEIIPAIKSESLEMIEKLVSFDTTSRDSNLGLIEWVRDWLQQLGVESSLVYNKEKNKANLFATIHGKAGKLTTPGIVLSGHTDVVPVDGQAWTPIRSRRPSRTAACSHAAPAT